MTYERLLAELIDNDFELRRHALSSPAYPHAQSELLRIVGHGQILEIDYHLMQKHPEVTAQEVQTATGVRLLPPPPPESEPWSTNEGAHQKQ